MTADAYHITAPAPNGEGAARAMRRAVEESGVPVEGFDYINAHGTSTPFNDEFETMGTNVLAVKPRVCVTLNGNPRTMRRLQDAGAIVIQYEGQEISLKGAGGPTCLTRPIRRG